jgi:hypothetical protein
MDALLCSSPVGSELEPSVGVAPEAVRERTSWQESIRVMRLILIPDMPSQDSILDYLF